MSDARSRSSSARSVRIATATLALATAAGPLLFGGALGWTVPVIAALSAVSALVSAWAAWRADRPMHLGLPLLVLVGGTLWTALQAVSIPCGLAGIIAPDALDHATRAADLFEAPLRCTISQDPGRTREEVLKGLALVSLFVSASLVGSVARRDAVLEIATLTCVAVALAALGHMVFAATSIWGLYEPLHGSTTLGPFVNANHLGGLLAMGAPIALGLSLSRRRREQRGPWTVAAIFLLACVAVTLSRGAILAALGGMGLFGLLTSRIEAAGTRDELRSRFEKLILRPLTLSVVPFLLGALVIGGAVGLDALQREVDGGDTTKLALIRRALELAVSGPWVGVGRGAFGVAFVERADTGQVRFEYAESFPAQWAVDWGIVVGPAIVIALTIAVVRVLRRVDRPHLFGALAGLSAYVAQNLVDFGVEMLGSAAVATVVLAACTSDRVSSDSVEPVAVRRSIGVAVVSAVLTLAATVLLGAGVHAQRVENARARLEAALAADDRDGFAREVRAAATLHPREPIFPLLAAAEGTRHDDERTLAYLNRAMQLAPAWDSPRLLAGRHLIRTGHVDQGLLEIREAMERDIGRAVPTACEVLRQRPTAETLLRMAPRNAGRRDGLVALVNCMPHDAPDGDAVDQAILEAEPAMIEPRVRLAARALGRGDLEAAMRWARPAEGRVAPPELDLVRARVHIARGEPDLALRVAAEAEQRSTHPWAAVEMRARAHASARDFAAMRDTVGELRGLAGSDATALGNADMVLGELERAGGNRGRALAAYEDAWRSFERLDALAQVADLAQDLGDQERASAARRVLCERDVVAYCAAETPPTP